MTKPLDAETKRLHGLSPAELARRTRPPNSPAELADEVGTVKAQISDREAQLEVLKAEAVRRGLGEAEGALFRVTLSPPGTQLRVDSKLLRQVMGDAFVDHFSRSVDTDWIMRCFGRKAA